MVNVRFLMTREDAALLAEIARVQGVSRAVLVSRLLAPYRRPDAALPRTGPQPPISPEPQGTRCEQLLLGDACGIGTAR